MLEGGERLEPHVARPGLLSRKRYGMQKTP